MFSKVRVLLASAALASALVLTACGGEGGTGGGAGALSVDSTEGIAYEQTTLTAPANTATSVTFNNESAGLQHNWVLVRGGDDVAAQVNTAGQADPSDYVPNDDPNVIAATELLNGGASGDAQVPALPAGSYTYLCTFPGHYDAGMKGVLTVQ